MTERVHDVVIKESRQNQELSKKQDFKLKIVSHAWESTGALWEQYVFRTVLRGLGFHFLWALFKTESKVLESP